MKTSVTTRSYLTSLAIFVAGCFSPEDPEIQNGETETHGTEAMRPSSTTADTTDTGRGASTAHENSDDSSIEVSVSTSGESSDDGIETSGNALPEDSSSSETSEPGTEAAEETQGGSSDCGDGIVQARETCDDGNNDGAYGGCMPGCLDLAPFCGDHQVDASFSESCDGDDGCNDNCRFSGEMLADVSMTGAPRAVVAHPNDLIVVGGFTGARLESEGDARAMLDVWESNESDGELALQSHVLFASSPRTGSDVIDASVIRAALAMGSGETLLVGQRRDANNNFDWVASVDSEGELVWETYGLFAEHGGARLVGVTRISDETVAVLGRRVVAGSNDAFIAAQRVGASSPVWMQQIVPDGIPYPETIGGATSEAGFFGVGSLYYGGVAEASFYRFDAAASIQESRLLRPVGEGSSVFLFAVSSLEGDAIVVGAAATSSGAGVLYPWIARVSAGGEMIWDYHDFDYPFSNTETQSGFTALAVDTLGTIVAAGGSPDPGGAQLPLVVKLDGVGNPVWRSELPAMAEQPACFYSASAVTLDRRGDVIVATEADSSCLSENDVLEARGRLSKLAG